MQTSNASTTNELARKLVIQGLWRNTTIFFWITPFSDRRALAYITRETKFDGSSANGVKDSNLSFAAFRDLNLGEVNRR